LKLKIRKITFFVTEDRELLEDPGILEHDIPAQINEGDAETLAAIGNFI
jgi:hypothetical protein